MKLFSLRNLALVYSPKFSSSTLCGVGQISRPLDNRGVSTPVRGSLDAFRTKQVVVSAGQRLGTCYLAFALEASRAPSLNRRTKQMTVVFFFALSSLDRRREEKQ